MPRGLIGRLIVSFALAITCFVASTFYAQSISLDIDDAALSIARDAMPSIQYLAEMRTELRRFETGVARWAASRHPDELHRLGEARSYIDDAFARYLAQADNYPGEPALWGEIHRALAQVDHRCDALLAEMRAGPPTVVTQSACRDAIEAMSATVQRDIDLNLAEGERLALGIEHGHRRSMRVALFLDLWSTIFTAIVAWLSVRALASHHRVVEERNRLVARRAEELEQFASRVAHDVLGPLSATRLALGHAESQVTDPGVKRSLARGQRGISRVATIVDGLLRFARAGARPEPGVLTRVGPVMERAIADLLPEAEAAGVTLTLAPPPECAVHGNPGVLVSVVENLVRNAIKYIGERAERRVDVRVVAKMDTVRIEVEDTGPGIAPALVETIFDPHVRGRGQGQPGIGLGLATVKRIAEAHGGRVGVQSRLDAGSLFWCELARADVSEVSQPVARHAYPERSNA
jgi:signal transduction histidine kinase